MFDECDRQTDKWTDTSRRLWPRLCMASCGKRSMTKSILTKVFSKKYFQNTILFCIFKILFWSILYFIFSKYFFNAILFCILKILLKSILLITGKRPVWTFRFSGRWTALTSMQLTRKYGATSLLDKSAKCEWFEVASDWCVIWSETERYWRWHWSVAQTSPCLHSS